MAKVSNSNYHCNLL